MFYQIFLSPQVKRSVIISNKNGICNCLTVAEGNNLIKLGNIRKSSKLHRIIAQRLAPHPHTK